MDPFTLLGDPDLSFDHSGGLMGNLLQYSARPSGTNGTPLGYQKLPDLGYIGSNSRTQSPGQPQQNILET